MIRKKIALIGCGAWGMNYARVISHNQHCELTIAYDSDYKKLEKVKLINPQTIIAENLNTVFNNKDVDGIVVSTNVLSHFEIVKESLLAGKHVLCEKPITRTFNEASQLKLIAEEKKLVLMVGHIFLYHDGINYIKEILQKKELGDLMYLNFKRTGLGPIRDDVNVLWDLASHDFSILSFFLEKNPISITTFAKTYIQNNIEDVAFINLEYENNIFANIHVSWIEPIKQRIITLVGNKKMLVFDDVSLDDKIKIYDKGISYQTSNGDFGAFQLAIRDGEIVMPNIRYNEPLNKELTHFIECMAGNLMPVSNSSSALDVMRLLEAAQLSISMGNKKIIL